MNPPLSLKLLLPVFAALRAVLPCIADGAEPKPARAADSVAHGKRHVYKHSAGKARELEVYFPPNHAPGGERVPALILFHGGGWSGGELSQFRFACHYFASRGLVTATAEYQMLGKADAAKLPEGETRKRVCITDAKSAIRWLKQHADELGLDPSRVIAGGGSAGGHISALATLNPGLNDPADPTDIDTRVVAYLWFNPAFAPDDTRDPEVDVLRHLKSDAAPSIAFFGTEDSWLKGWKAASSKLKTLGHVGLEEWFAPGQGHAFFNKQPWRSLTLIEADRFLVGQGLLKGEPTLALPDGDEKLVRQP